MKQSEADIQRQIVDYLKIKHIFFWRNNTGALPTKKGFIRFGQKGSGDILCVHKGRFYAIECKSKTGVQSASQKEWQAGLELAGGKYIIARCVEDITNLF